MYPCFLKHNSQASEYLQAYVSKDLSRVKAGFKSIPLQPNFEFPATFFSLFANNFSAEEILEKHLSLKGVLEPYTSQANLDFLRRAGFSDVAIIYKNICFEGILAIK